MLNDDRSQLMIFCDGGIGNRINSLISGLAIARHFNLTFCVYWPENNWCQASFGDIFRNPLPTSKLSISNLSKKLGDAIVLLHDDIASKRLEVEFNSAYQYSSMQDFSDKVLSAEKNIFYYPALMPQWVPFEVCIQELRSLSFTDYISQSVSGFVNEVLKKPFHGLHLRRTDLNVGLNDHEVINLVQRHPDETFFVCSDDPVAEAIASAHPNVFARSKAFHVNKKNNENSWLNESADDDGRIYYGNIQRGKEAVIEGAIDLLILAHSQIVGYSGSTFQRIAKIIGENSPILKVQKPSPLTYFSPAEVLKQLKVGLLKINEFLGLCNQVGLQGDMKEAAHLLHEGLNCFNDSDALDILHTLGIISLNQGQAQSAIVYFKEVLNLESNRFSTWVHLAYSYYLRGDDANREASLARANMCQPAQIATSDAQIIHFINSQTSNLTT